MYLRQPRSWLQSEVSSAIRTDLSVTGRPSTLNDENDMSVSQHMECIPDIDVEVTHNE